MMSHLYNNTTNYDTLVKKIYFTGILKKIIKVGDLVSKNKTILDFGCGIGKLKDLLINSNKNVINYDIVKEFSEVSYWNEKYFNVLVANEVFYTFEESELRELLQKLRKFNPELTLLVGISKQTIINKIGSFIFNDSKSHLGTKISPKKEIKILLEYTKLLRKTSKYFLVDIYLLKFK